MTTKTLDSLDRAILTLLEIRHRVRGGSLVPMPELVDAVNATPNARVQWAAKEIEDATMEMVRCGLLVWALGSRSVCLSDAGVAECRKHGIGVTAGDDDAEEEDFEDEDEEPVLDDALLSDVAEFVAWVGNEMDARKHVDPGDDEFTANIERGHSVVTRSGDVLRALGRLADASDCDQGLLSVEFAEALDHAKSVLASVIHDHRAETLVKG